MPARVRAVLESIADAQGRRLADVSRDALAEYAERHEPGKGELMAVRTVFVDYNRIGSSTSFRVPLSRAERDGLQVGDTVALTGDPDMPEQHAKVTELTPDGCAVLELVASSRRGAAG